MLRTNLSTYNNSWYNPGAGFLKRVCWYFVNACFFTSYFPINSVKIILLRLFGAKIGKGVIVKPAVNIKYPWKLEVGNHVWIGEKVWIDNLAQVTLSDNVCLSQGSFILCGNHNYKKTSFDLMTAPVFLHEGVWIGANAVVCPGVICFSHAVLTVGSVANRNLEEYTIYQGNPALSLKKRMEE